MIKVVLTFYITVTSTTGLENFEFIERKIDVLSFLKATGVNLNGTFRSVYLTSLEYSKTIQN